MTWYLILKFLAIIFFLIMFLRRPSLVWGVGLLTITSAVLLDTLFGTFDREALEAELGFFYFIVAGLLFAGAAFWLWGLLWPRMRPVRLAYQSERLPEEIMLPGAAVTEVQTETSDTFIDRQMMFQEIRERFGREDVLDLMFDLELNESDVMPLDQDMNRLIINIIAAAERQDKGNQLALAVERILTPPPAEHLPRLERLNADSPPTVLRQFLLAHYALDDLQETAEALEIDWEQLDNGAKREKARSLLQYLYRRNRIEELVALLQRREGIEAESP